MHRVPSTDILYYISRLKAFSSKFSVRSYTFGIKDQQTVAANTDGL